MTHSPSEIAKAQETVAKIMQMVTDVLRPMELQMVVMQWAPEFRSIMWEAIGRQAMVRAVKAKNEKEPRDAR